jgi:putative ABC transport system permease protein
LLAGLSPALLLSRFRPVETLRKLNNVKVFSYLNVRKSLIVIQFAVSLIFIMTVVTMNRQFKHLVQADLGFNTDNIINVNLQNQSYELYKQAISSYKEISGVSASSILPATHGLSGTTARKPGSPDSVYLAYLSVDPNYIENVDLKLIAGRYFTTVDSADNERFIILNEQAVQAFQFTTPQEAIGQSIQLEGKNLEVIGVVKDFVTMDVNEPMRATALRNYAEFYTYVNVRVSGYETSATLQALEAAWKSLGTKRPFQYQFYDEALARANLGIIITLRVVGFAGILAILIACMGLLGMVLYTTEARQKEVSIRKVLGADAASLVFLLSKGFLKLMAIAILIGAPAAYFINNLWLQSYAYRIQIGVGILAMSIVALLGLALLTIGAQVWKTAVANPVESLKTE